MPIASFSMPGLVERKMRELWNDLPSTNSGDIDALGDSIDQVTRNTGIPAVMGAGMVLNPKNVSKMAGALEKTFKSTNINQINKALAYVAMKYPMLSKLPNYFTTATKRKLGKEIAGHFDYTEGVVRILKDLEGDTRINPVVDIIAHELMHARQYSKNKDAFKGYKAIAKVGLEENKKQPVEQQAYRAGSVARKTLENFLEKAGKQAGTDSSQMVWPYLP